MNTQALYAALWFFGYGFQLACVLPALGRRSEKIGAGICLFCVWPLIAGAMVVDLIQGRGWPWDTQRPQ